MESLKTLVPQPGQDKVASEGSVKVLPGVRQKRGSSLRQVLAALSANIGTINTGMAFGFSAVTIPQLQSPDSAMRITDDQASWIASLSAVTTPIGCILSGYLMDVLGRKRILVFTQLPMILGWLLIGSANSVGMIYAGRLLVGLGSGMVGAPARVYTCESTQPHLRGMLSALASVGVSLGVTVEYALGALFDWKTMAFLSSSVPMLALITGCLLPESPSWLVSVGKNDECKASLSRLPIKPFIILALYFLIYQFSGVNPVTFYAVEVFKDSGATMNVYLLTVILGLVRLFFTVVGCVLMRRCGRRPLTFISSIGCGLSMVGLGTYMCYALGWEIPQATWFPVFCIMFFTATSTIGYLVVPWVMIGEVYPTQVRGIIGGMTTCVGHFCVFIVVKTFPMMQKTITKYGTFWLYGGISLAGTFFFYFCLPETKGRTLQEIEDYFSGRTKTLAKPKQKDQLAAASKNHPVIVKAQKGDSMS
ncbi:hypothetical protein AAG570_002540 [Ranatra chinensis]|uniref:Major facilitator superfamily (MFS) profile domain-containing protein n=1 Tax=Ranatra chinensis TaxID=642074 RepID=A0ABD0Y7V3_9HEMI